ncbi:hypothetical protein DB30_05106 [Enhygromyxa salina]|uniref:Uncharacterized protein n=1 Tax=Enhygromyxa salina TaxID=215803 RepID=A0A0C2D2B4_9BACT|nr:hypothetical protein DB30_05106 [Enhygromyxa salina]
MSRVSLGDLRERLVERLVDAGPAIGDALARRGSFLGETWTWRDETQHLLRMNR